MKISRARLERIRLPLREVLGRLRADERETLIVTLENETGLQGFGEAAPIPPFPTESLEQSAAALRRALEGLVGHQAPRPDALPPGVASALAERPCARAAIELALFDLLARANHRPLARLLADAAGGTLRDRVTVNALLVGESPAALGESAARARRDGFDTVKWKLAGRDPEREHERARAVREAMGTRGRLRLDANEGLDEAGALELARRLAPLELEYLEQPLPRSELQALARLRRAGGVPVAADEAATRPEDARAVIAAGAADVLVVKPSLCGGPLAALDIARAAHAAGLRVVVTTALESAVGAAGAAHLAAVVPDPLEACGLATGSLLADDLAAPFRVCGGVLRLPEGPGLGFVPEAEAMRRLRIGPAEERVV